MRCENCGADLGSESTCPACDGGVIPPQYQPPDKASSFMHAGWWCVLLALIAIFVLAPMFACPGTIPALKLGAVEIGIGLVCSVWAALRALRRRDFGVGAKAVVCIVALAGCSVAGVLSYMSFPHSPYARRQTRGIKSLNNVKQLAIALQTYADDYGALPGWVHNLDGRYAHNTWDEQINSQVKAKDAFNNGDTGVRSYSQSDTHDRVLTYGLNGLLITPPKPTFDGNADYSSITSAHPPAPMKPRDIIDPSGTILFAEFSTNAPMPGRYGQVPDPKPHTWTDGESTSQWQGAHDGWIDISPRAFVEIASDASNNPYQEPYGKNAETGIARTLYGGGGVYAFADGHAQFLKIGKTVGLGTALNGKTVTEQNCWKPWNTHNMWNPR